MSLDHAMRTLKFTVLLEIDPVDGYIVCPVCKSSGYEIVSPSQYRKWRRSAAARPFWPEDEDGPPQGRPPNRSDDDDE